MNTIVISNVHRPPLILPFVQSMNPVVSLTPDYPYPAIGHFRCFHGHTNALTVYMKDPTAVVFEDDAVPDNTLPWQEMIHAAGRMIEAGVYEVVCLHGRGFDFKLFDPFEYSGFKWLRPCTRDRWVLGTLVYVIGRAAAERWAKAHFWTHGTNIDLFLWSHRFNFAMLDFRQFVDMRTTTETLVGENPKPFLHDRSQGSILENPRNTEVVNR